MKIYRKKIYARTVLSSLLSTPFLAGAGFQLAERSASGLGRAFSGEAAYAEDASVLASNPAAMIMLGGNWNYSIGVNLIDVTAEVEGAGPLGPLSDDSAGKTSFVPTIYGTKRVNEDIVVGLGVFSTYGLVTDYSTSFADQAGIDLSEVISVNLNPSIAWRLNDVVTIGAGLNFVYAEGDITSRSPQAIQAGPGVLFDLEGDDFAFGFNIGVLFEVTDRINLGLHYRSSLDLEVEGDAQIGAGINNIAGGLVALPGNYDASLDVELPETFEASLLYRATDKLDLHADIFWTNWDKVPRLAPQLNGTINDAAVNSILNTELDWEATFRYAVGATYRPTSKLTLRTGIAFDESPVEDSQRTLRIPDRDRFWISFGASYQFGENYTVDFGYSHLFAEDAPINDNEPFFNGEVSGNANIYALSISGQF